MRLICCLFVWSLLSVSSAYGVLSAQYLMEEGVNTSAGDSSGQGNNSYFEGNVSWTDGHGGNSLNGLSFDGINYLVVEDSASLDAISSGFSFTAWVKPEQNSTNADCFVWKLGAFRIWKQNANLLVSFDGVSTVTDFQLISGLLVNGVWQHIAVTYDGSYITGYLNGGLKRRIRVNSTPAAISTSNYPLRIGWYNGTTNYRGALDNVRLYNEALSVPAVTADMNSDTMTAAEPLTIVQAGVATTAIIIPDGLVDQAVTAAAEELRYHIEQASGVSLAIFTEGNKPGGYDGLIYIGPCQATSRAGIQGDYLRANSYVIRNFGTDLFLAGNDSYGTVFGAQHVNKTRVGTLFAVYRFLEREMAIKWLWPGKSGEVIPHRSDLTVQGLDVIDEPVLAHTRLRDYGGAAGTGWGGTAAGWSSAVSRDQFLSDQSVWLRRHGFAQNINLEYGHSFITWWDQYGSTHPNYFNLLPDGTRRSDPTYWNGPGELISMCMSQPGLWDQVVDNWVAAGANEWINCSMNDTPTKDVDPCSMVWDVPDPQLEVPWEDRLTAATAAFNAGERDWYRYLGSTSDRYAKFILAVQQEAQSRGYNDAVVLGYAYTNRMRPPLETQLNDRVIMGIVPAMSFPWTEAKQAENRAQWSGWTEFAGTQAFLRPNYFLDGHNMPIFIARRFGTDFIYSLRRGMIATDFDSLTGQFSTQGPNLYTLARVQTHVAASGRAWGADLNGDGRVDLMDFADLADHWLNNAFYCGYDDACADLNGDDTVDSIDLQVFASQWLSQSPAVEAILDEFYSAFGPAASAVRDYFDHWEQVSDQATVGGSYSSWNVAAPQIFTPAIMAQGRALMTQAVQAAQGNVTAERLVGYLEKGLTNAELTLTAQRAWETYQVDGVYGPWQDAIMALDTYRAVVDPCGIGNMAWLYQCENRTWRRTLPTTTVSAGDVFAIHGDGLSKMTLNDETLLIFNDLNNDGAASVLLDVGSVKAVNAIQYINTLSYSATNYAAKKVQILVAPDESAESFDVYTSGSYSIEIFNGNLTPLSNAGGVARLADSVNVSRRYFLLRFTDNFWGAVGSSNSIFGGDIGIVEP